VRRDGLAAADGVFFSRGSAPDPGSVARGDPCAPLRSLASASRARRSRMA